MQNLDAGGPVESLSSRIVERVDMHRLSTRVYRRACSFRDGSWSSRRRRVNPVAV